MNSDALKMYVGTKIEECRNAMGITQQSLATRIGIARANMIRIEKGLDFVSLQRLFDIAAELEVDAKYLLPTNEWYAECKDKKVRKVITFEVVD